MANFRPPTHPFLSTWLLNAPLHEILILLFDFRGADVNAKDYKGCTPLRLARRYGQDDIETMLIEKGAKDEQDPPSRKQSIGPDPPWMVSSRKSSAVAPSRREGLSIGAN